MKDASKRSRAASDDHEEDSKRTSDSTKTEKQKRRKLRKRRSSCSPEEDVIDGFVIASYSSLHSLEIVDSPRADSSAQLEKELNGKQQTSSKLNENGHNPKSFKESKKANCDGESSKSVKRKTNEKKGVDSKKSFAKVLRQPLERLTDDSSDSGNSEKGYICDGESEDEQVPAPEQEKSKTPPSESKEVEEIAPPKCSQSQEEEIPKIEKSSPVSFKTERLLSSPKSKITYLPALSLAVSSSSPNASCSSRPTNTQSSWLPQLSSSFQKPSTAIDPCCVKGSYTGSDALHQELNSRFLQSHSERERHSHSKGHELHQHSHLHHHQHQHQHTHYYPPPLIPPTLFPATAPVPGMLSTFSTPVPTYGSHSVSSYHKKTGKWCTAHVQIAWKIYYHQQRVQTEMAKDPHVKPEHIAISKSTATIVPPFPTRHMSPSDLGCRSPHLHASRFSGSPLTKPSIFVGRSGGTSSPYGSTVTTTTSAFSSVFSPATSVHRTGSPILLGPSSVRVSSSSEPEKRALSSGSSTLYPWLKSENTVKDLSSVERRERPESDSEKKSYQDKNELQRRSPSRLSNNFSIQALASERSDTRRPPAVTVLDSAGSFGSREARPSESRSFLDSPRVPLEGLEKKPFEYRPSVGSIDLNRNTLYPRYDPMMAMHPPHVASLTPPIGLSYSYPEASFMSDSMYHSPLGQGMYFGPRDPMPSLGRSLDVPFLFRRDLSER